MFFAKDADSRPEADAHDPSDFLGVDSVFPAQQARPLMLGSLKNIQIEEGKNTNGNPIAALVIAIEMLKNHTTSNRSKSWAKEIVLLTQAEAKLKQGGWQDVLQMLVDEGIRLKVM